MNIKIQTAKSNDWQIIQKLNNQVFLTDQNNDDDLDMNWPFSSEGVSYFKKLASGKYGKCFIAYFENKPVGYTTLSLQDFGYRKSKYVEVENMGVEPEFRSQGIGKLLLDEAVSWAKQQGATKLFVSAYWKNKRAINFYKKNSFYESKVELERKLQ